MLPYVIIIGYGAVLFMVARAAIQGHRGRGLRDTPFREEVSDRVLTDPELRGRANRVIRNYGLAASAMCIPPIIAMINILRNDIDRHVSTPFLIFLTVYTAAIICVALYPAVHIRKM